MTNRANLPDAIVRAVTNDSYSSGDSDYTITGLLKPPQMARLQREFHNQIEEDASDRIWSLLGQAVHTILERAGGNEVKETRVFAHINGLRISAQIDNLCLESGTLSDYKITTGWKFKNDKPPDPDFITQLNIQKYLLELNNMSVTRLQIVGILRDWSKLEASRDGSYPQSQVIVQPIPIWTSDQCLAYLEMRIRAHESANTECDSNEMWEKPTTYAVMKRGAARATKVLYKQDSAIGYADQLGDKYKVVTRPGERVRCTNYCSVNKFCSQFKQYKESMNENAASAVNGERE